MVDDSRIWETFRPRKRLSREMVFETGHKRVRKSLVLSLLDRIRAVRF